MEIKRSFIFILIIIGLPYLLTAQHSHCGYQNETSSLGIGVIEWNDENAINYPFLELYNDPDLKNLYVKWSYYENAPTKPVCLKFDKPDYGIAKPICLGANKKFFKVLINGDEEKSLPNNGNYQLLPWEKFLKNAVGIRRMSEAPDSIRFQTIRVGPSHSEEEVDFDVPSYCICEVKGDWVELVLECIDAEELPSNEDSCGEYVKSCVNPQTGWILWRDGNKLLIDVFLLY